MKGATTNSERASADFRLVWNFFILIVGVGILGAIFAAVSISGWRFWSVMLWSLALLASGAGVGFLFGIPKVVQSDATPTAHQTGTDTPPSPLAGYRQKVNTNLEEISDWLTKIIVGFGLIQLKTAPEYLRRLTALVGGSFGTDVPAGFGASLVLFFGVSGFLFGYLVTRLFLQGALARAERSVLIEGILGQFELEKRGKEAQQDVTKALAQIPKDREAAMASPGGMLQALANQYLRIEIPDWSQRVKAKNELAAQMAALVIKEGISRDELAASTHEGYIMALAAAVQHTPEPEDTRRLLAAAGNAHRLHVQYRFVLAFSRLLESNFVDDADKGAIAKVLQGWEARADESLRLAIAGLRRQLS